MAEFYTFDTEAEAITCINAINNSGWFPVVGNCNGSPVPNNQQTIKWCDEPRELKTGKWAVPRIPTNRLDLVGVPQVDRDAFLAVYGQDIQELVYNDFVVIEE